jgi:hypothetical protein
MAPVGLERGTRDRAGDRGELQVAAVAFLDPVRDPEKVLDKGTVLSASDLDLSVKQEVAYHLQLTLPCGRRQTGDLPDTRHVTANSHILLQKQQDAE